MAESQATGESARNKSPIFFGLEVTRRCNLRCPHCFTGASAEQHPGPSAEQVRGLFKQLLDIGVDHLAFSGGEPLIRDDLEELMSGGLELGMKSFSLVTNGLLVDARRAGALERAGLVNAQVSLDGVDARDHCAMRGCSPAAYYRTLRAIRLLREAKIVVDVAMILAGPNLTRAGEMVHLCRALGVRTLRYCSFVPTGRAAREPIRRNYQPSAEAQDAFLEFLRTYRAQRRRPLDVVIDHGIGPWNLRGDLRCVAGRRVAYIRGEGDLYPCPALMHAPFRVGNVYERPLRELLSSPELHRVRRLRRSQLREPCRSCLSSGCSGGCRGSAFAASGELEAAPAYCNFLRRSARLTPGAASESHDDSALP